MATSKDGDDTLTEPVATQAQADAREKPSRRAREEIVRRFSLLNPIGQCLEEALDHVVSKSAQPRSLRDNDDTDRDDNDDNDDSDDNDARTEEEEEEEDDGADCSRELVQKASDHARTEETSRNQRGKRKASMLTQNHERPDEESCLKDQKKKRPCICVDQRWKGEIIKAFGDAVVGSPWYPEDNKSHSPREASSPPAVLLKGRINSYQRFGGQWRLWLEKGAQLIPRRNLTASQRKLQHGPRADRLSLWDWAANGEQPRTTQHSERQQDEIVTLKDKTLILANDDC